MSRTLWAAPTWLTLAGFYLFLAGNVAAVEIIAMILCAALGTALAIGLSRAAKEHYTPRPPPRAILRPIAALLPELIVVGRELMLASVGGASLHRGKFVDQPFDFGGDTPVEASRRAVTLIGISLAPRSFVVRGDRVGSTALLHELPPKPLSPDRRWPV